MRLARRRGNGRALIGLTPLIDVVFILLVFFMLASSFTDWRAIDLATAGRTVSAATDDAALLMAVQADGGIILGGETLAAAALPARLAALHQAIPDRPVAVRPQPGVPLQAVVTVMETASRAGFTRVSLVGGSAAAGG